MSVLASGTGERPIVNIECERVALGPLRRDLLPLYQRWSNDFATLRNLTDAPAPRTMEQGAAWYDRASAAGDEVRFTIYKREGWRPLGTTTWFTSTGAATPPSSAW